ncbi:MAG: hypothetical protein ABIP29_12635 [Candidatus Eisenbacteria bacterium]
MPRRPQLPARFSHPRVVVIALTAIALLVALVVFLLQAVLPRLSQRDPLPSLDESRRRVAGIQLARYAARAEHGTFLPPAALTIAVHEDFLQRSLAASLPFEQVFDDGQIEARLDSASVDVLDGATTLTLRGRGRSIRNPAVYADLIVQGTLGIEDVDFERGRIIPRLEFTDVRVVDSASKGLGSWTNPVAAYFTHRSAAEWNRFQPLLPLPIQFNTRVELPAVEGDVTLPSVAFPVQLRFAALTALERRLVLSIELLPDSSQGSPAGPPTGPWDAPPGAPQVHVRDRLLGIVTRRSTAVLPPAPTPGAINQLRSKVLRLARADSLWNTIRESEHDLTILAPEPLLATIVGSATDRYRKGVEVALDPDLDEWISEEINAKFLGKTVKAGQVRAAIHVDRVQGRLVATGEPGIHLRPPDGLAVALPLKLIGGRGTARFDVEWDPKALAGVVCKGFKAQRRLDGVLGEIQHRVSGTLRFTVEEGHIIGRSALRRDRVRLPLDLTTASWGRVRAVFEEQDRAMRCGAVMDPDIIVGKLRALGRKGVRVRLPGGLPGFELPVAFGNSVIDSTYLVGANVSDLQLTMTRSALVVTLDGLVALRTLPELAGEPTEAAALPTATSSASGSASPRRP